MQSINVCVVRSMGRFTMNPVPNRHNFIKTVHDVLYADFFLKMENTAANQTKLFDVIQDCLLEMFENDKPKEDSKIDILSICKKISALSEFGAHLDVHQVQTLQLLQNFIREYRQYPHKIDTTNKTIPTEYVEQDEEHFIQDTMDFLAMLYNTTENKSKFWNPIRECVGIFWEIDVTWRRKSKIATLDDIEEMKENLFKIILTQDDELSDTGKKIDSFRRYLHNWIYFKKNPTKKPRPDLNTRVEQLEHEIQELQAQVQALTNEFSSAHVPTLERQSLLQKLARLT